jgi:hypothetical protein
MNSNLKTNLVFAAFCIAMAALESAVVVYLRALYYPNGFTVAMQLIDNQIILVEIIREAATIVMLLTVAYLIGKNQKERFAYFLLGFAIWDIFYYVWLKIFIDWPSSFLEWDILFLIPVTWLGPVLAPIICSITMIAIAMVVLKYQSKIQFNAAALLLFTVGSFIILFTFIYDYSAIVIQNDFLSDFLNLNQNPKFITIASNYLPSSFNWLVFGIGEFFTMAATLKLFTK